MKYAIFSDIHSNFDALKKAYSLAEKEADKFICLGDIVGYNAFPQQCVNFMTSRGFICVKGNHDDIIGWDCDSPSQYIGHFSEDACVGVRYCMGKLNKKSKKWLRELPMHKEIDDTIKFIIGHAHIDDGGPFSIGDYPYVLGEYDARYAMNSLMENFNCRLMFIGHTHIQTVISRKFKNSGYEDNCLFAGSVINEDLLYVKNKRMHYLMPDRLVFDISGAFEQQEWFIINPGSIGQPRGNTPVSFVILDTDNKTVKFVPFWYNNIKAAQAILDAGYSTSLANRLSNWKI